MAVVSKGKVHDVFTARIAGLRGEADAMFEAFRGNQQRVWQAADKALHSLTDVENMHKGIFDREEINANYSQIAEDQENLGSGGDVAGLKLQIDYLAVEERAFRVRHMSLSRAFHHAHARARGQGKGPLWGENSGVMSLVKHCLRAGGADV